MRFSLRLNNDLPVASYVELAREAEAAGFDQLWVSHDLFLRSAPVLVARMLEETETLQVGIGILNPYTVHPAEIAMLAATFDEAYEQRFLLGLAAGARDFLDWVGLEQRRPLAAVREAVATVRSLRVHEPKVAAGNVEPTVDADAESVGGVIRGAFVVTKREIDGEADVTGQ